MELQFEILKEYDSQGEEFDFYHLPNEIADFLFLKDGRLMSQGFRVPQSSFDTIFDQNIGLYDVSKHDHITDLTLRKLDRFGLVGSYRTGDEHYLILFELAVDVSDYVVSGLISESKGNPIRQIQLQLENPLSEEKTHGDRVLVSENGAFAIPGSMIQVAFEVDGETTNFGKFYVDHASWDVLQSSASLDGRSITGRKLKDKTINDHNVSEIMTLENLLKKMIVEIGGIYSGDVEIQSTNRAMKFECEPQTELLSAIIQALEREPTWTIKESFSGRIIVGSNNTYGQFGLSHRNMFRRQIALDDANVYSKVCVWCNYTEVKKTWENTRKEQQVTGTDGQTTTQWVDEWTEKETSEKKVRRVYKDVPSNKYFGLENGKTLFVQLTDESWEEELVEVADNLIARIEKVGRTEDVTTPFAPWLECGDEGMYDGESLGLVSKISHKFGRSGAFTELSIDSGGTLATKSLKDYLAELTKETQRASALSKKN